MASPALSEASIAVIKLLVELEKAINAKGLKYVTAFHHAASWFFFPTWDETGVITNVFGSRIGDVPIAQFDLVNADSGETTLGELSAIAQLPAARALVLVLDDADEAVAALLGHYPGITVRRVIDSMPPAAAIVDPKRPDCSYPDKRLAGVGVMYQLLRGLVGRLEHELDLNRDLFLLEEDLLFPANTQVALFVSMDVGEYFSLDSVSLTIDGKEVSNYLYTSREVDALVRGGVHRLHVANLKAGEHELIAVFTGKGPHQRDYRRAASFTVDKGLGARYVELKISDRVPKQQPEFVIKEWE